MTPLLFHMVYLSAYFFSYPSQITVITTSLIRISSKVRTIEKKPSTSFTLFTQKIIVLYNNLHIKYNCSPDIKIFHFRIEYPILHKFHSYCHKNTHTFRQSIVFPHFGHLQIFRVFSLKYSAFPSFSKQSGQCFSVTSDGATKPTFCTKSSPFFVIFPPHLP